MNSDLFYYSIAEIGISIALGTSILFLSYRLIDRLFRIKYDIKFSNVSFAIFTSSVLFSVAYLISGIKAPILNSLRLIASDSASVGNPIMSAFLYLLLYLGIVIFAIATVNFIAVRLFIFMTKTIDEFEEIAHDNVAISIITATIIICVSLLVKDSLYLLLDSFVPYHNNVKFN